MMTGIGPVAQGNSIKPVALTVSYRIVGRVIFTDPPGLLTQRFTGVV